MNTQNKILVFNAGSSSLRFELFDLVGKKLKSAYRGHFDNHDKPIKNFQKAVSRAINMLIEKKVLKNISDIKAIGHRVVHGTEKYTKPTKINAKVITAIRKFSNLAPLHNPPNLACILACRKLFKKITQVAVFDTAFHQTMPEKAYIYGLPYALAKKLNIRRFGFHGTSHKYVFEQARKKLGEKATRRTVTCHLGNGCSITAILNGKVVDTSMGFTPLEGVPMGTRSGDIDPSIIFYMMNNGFSPEETEKILNKKSGLAGVSEVGSDVRDLWAAYKKHDPRAKRTFAWFAYRIAKYIGAYTAALGGLDCIVFTGGIGENAFYLRKWILNYLKFLPHVKTLVIPTNEELKIAEETLKIHIF